MAKTVETVEYFFARRVWNVWSGRPIRDVDYDGLVSNVDGLEVESGPCFTPEPLKFWIQCLLSGDLVPVEAEISDCIDDAVEIRYGDFSFARGCCSVRLVRRRG